MTTQFLSGPSYEVSSGPLVVRRAHIDDVWPEGTGAGKDDLAPGDHMFFAIGPKAERPKNVVGMVLSYDTLTDLIELNVAPGAIYKAYVANILTYDQGAAATWAATIDKHVPVWVDDSAALPAGTTLSRSPLNSAGAGNPVAGFTWPDQDEWDDSGVGGGNSDPYPKSFTGNDATYDLLLTVMLWPSCED